MAGTNAVAVKQALVTALQAAPALASVQVSYAFPGELQRDSIYLGRTTFQHRLMAFQAGTRIPRDEQATTTLSIRSYVPGDKGEAAEARAVELGDVVEELLAGDPRMTGSGVPGLLVTKVASGELSSGADDEAGIAILTYRIDFRSQLT